MGNAKIRIYVQCPHCFSLLRCEPGNGEEGKWVCGHCGLRAPGTDIYIDLFDYNNMRTADHYSLQWGKEFNFLQYYLEEPKIRKSMPATQLGWDRLFCQIRARARSQITYVYDAACGFGGVAYELMKKPISRNLFYVGADIQNGLQSLQGNLSLPSDRVFFVRWDISKQLPVREQFDYVICRASLHHTPDPEKAFGSICRSLKPGGTVAISVYNKKSICRETVDDAMRKIISGMPAKEAFEICHQFTKLGKALQQVEQKVVIDENLPLLGIPQGKMGVHELFYYYFIKCFYNDQFGEQLSTLVNYDWYHPPYAFRYEIEEVKRWFLTNRIDITETTSIRAQHYLKGIKRK